MGLYRSVVKRRLVKSGRETRSVEMLDCGHTLDFPHRSTNIPNKRLCWKCGQAATSVEQFVADLVARRRRP